ncbi:MAG: hypothetical protein JNM68_14465, partial [Dinghuibacter sp.]|nr:hypothetical protein [Dinghuibacter sp.]
MIRIFIFITTLLPVLVQAQTTCSVQWAGNVIPSPGTLNCSFTAAGGIAGSWKSTNPTIGSYNAGRPNYLSAYGLMIGTSRGGGFGARTTITFASPVDFYRLRIWDLRGDGLTSEAQRIDAFNGGVSVTRSYSSDNPSLVNINAGTNTINGSTTTTSTSQGLVHVSFAGAVDSIIVRSVGNSDFVVIELLCPDFLADVALTPLQATLTANGQAQLNWQSLFEYRHSHFDIERSANGIDFEYAGTVVSRGTPTGTTGYRFTDPQPVNGTVYYRLKAVGQNGGYFYSEIVSLRGNSYWSVVYDAAGKQLVVTQATAAKTNYALYSPQGALLRSG